MEWDSWANQQLGGHLQGGGFSPHTTLTDVTKSALTFSWSVYPKEHVNTCSQKYLYHSLGAEDDCIYSILFTYMSFQWGIERHLVKPILQLKRKSKMTKMSKGTMLPASCGIRLETSALRSHIGRFPPPDCV